MLPMEYEHVLIKHDHIYHHNILRINYTTYDVGTQMVNLRPHKVQFLWVCWYELNPLGAGSGWKDATLDWLRFPLMANDDSFGFLDPADVIRAAHIIPAFSTGKRYKDEKGISPCVIDSEDWKSYYIGRYFCSH